MRKYQRVAIVVGATLAVAGGVGSSAFGARGDDTPQTVCHKPGTAAQAELTFDNDALTQAHLRHGDTEGPCTASVPEPPGGPSGSADVAGAAVAVPAGATTAG
jgi:hypothetical protein